MWELVALQASLYDIGKNSSVITKPDYLWWAGQSKYVTCQTICVFSIITNYSMQNGNRNPTNKHPGTKIGRGPECRQHCPTAF